MGIRLLHEFIALGMLVTGYNANPMTTLNKAACYVAGIDPAAGTEEAVLMQDAYLHHYTPILS